MKKIDITKIFWKLVLLGIAAFCIVLLAKSCSAIIKSASWHYDIDISYVYEGDSEDNIHHAKTDYTARYSSTVKDIDVVFSTEPGYINCLNLYIVVKDPGINQIRQVSTRRIMEVPDRRFKVVRIDYTKGPRIEK